MTDLKELFTRLVEIMDELREKCPWDQKQTIQTPRVYHPNIKSIPLWKD